jgi:hypothetical protein
MPEHDDPKQKAFRSQRMLSERRGIVFTFNEWLAWWEIDPRWERRAGFAVVTPDGRFDSIALAARHHGLRQTEAWLRARTADSAGDWMYRLHRGPIPGDAISAQAIAIMSVWPERFGRALLARQWGRIGIQGRIRLASDWNGCRHAGNLPDDRDVGEGTGVFEGVGSEGLLARDHLADLDWGPGIALGIGEMDLVGYRLDEGAQEVGCGRVVALTCSSVKANLLVRSMATKR